jgi:hypothetical protein
MAEMQGPRAKARANLTTAIDLARGFPGQVFLGSWSDFFFLDSNWMFDMEFVESAKTLLDLEGSTCACLANLNVVAGGGNSEYVFMIDRSTTAEAYGALLSGPTPGRGWLNDFERFGCTSDVSQWCLYCERASEIAVMAIRGRAALDRYLPVIRHFGAARIRDAIEQPISYVFSARALLPEWRRELVAEYSTGSNEERS